MDKKAVVHIFKKLGFFFSQKRKKLGTEGLVLVHGPFPVSPAELKLETAQLFWGRTSG